MKPFTQNRSFLRKPFLIKLGLETPSMIEVDGITLEQDTIGEHRIIAYDTGVVPNRVKYIDPGNSNRLLIVVSSSELKREGFSVESFRKALKDILISEFELVVND